MRTSSLDTGTSRAGLNFSVSARSAVKGWEARCHYPAHAVATAADFADTMVTTLSNKRRVSISELGSDPDPSDRARARRVLRKAVPPTAHRRDQRMNVLLHIDTDFNFRQD
jgi:hypothetical protein